METNVIEILKNIGFEDYMRLHDEINVLLGATKMEKMVSEASKPLYSLAELVANTDMDKFESMNKYEDQIVHLKDVSETLGFVLGVYTCIAMIENKTVIPKKALENQIKEGILL